MWNPVVIRQRTVCSWCVRSGLTTPGTGVTDGPTIFVDLPHPRGLDLLVWCVREIQTQQHQLQQQQKLQQQQQKLQQQQQKLQQQQQKLQQQQQQLQQQQQQKLQQQQQQSQFQ